MVNRSLEGVAIAASGTKVVHHDFVIVIVPALQQCTLTFRLLCQRQNTLFNAIPAKQATRKYHEIDVNMEERKKLKARLDALWTYLSL